MTGVRPGPFVNAHIEPGTVRFVLDPEHERLGMILGPCDLDAHEFVTWWLSTSQRWSQPEPARSARLSTLHWQDYILRGGILRTPTVRQMPAVIAKIRADRGVVIGGLEASTWYGIPAALGIFAPSETATEPSCPPS